LPNVKCLTAAGLRVASVAKRNEAKRKTADVQAHVMFILLISFLFSSDFLTF